jgi:hypothetical protein
LSRWGVNIVEHDTLVIDRNDTLAVAANLVRSKLEQSSIGSAPKIQTCLLGLKLQVLGTEDEIAIPRDGVVDDGAIDVGIDSFDERIPRRL